MRRILRVSFFAGLLIFLLPASVWGQASSLASINGKVTDDSGAAMPNVTVTVTSPSLQVAKITATTDAEGNYAIRDLPAPGIYQASYAAEGFQTYVRHDLNLSVGFVARVDVTMKVGQVSQTLEVTGSSPVIDMDTTAGSTTLQYDDIQIMPRGKGMQELFPMAAGVSLAGKPDVGDSNLVQNSNVITYGALLEPTMNVEGINIASGHDLDTAAYFSTFDLAETEIKTSGSNADIAFPGFDVESVMKSGGNAFHGSALGDWEASSLQGNNITSALSAQGLKVTNPLKDYYDYAGDIGGRIIRDKLWFYGGVSKQLSRVGQIGVVSGPDAAGCWTCGDAPPAYIIFALVQENMKIDYQPSSSVKVIWAWQHAGKYLSANSASPTLPVPSAPVQHEPIDVWKGEVQWVPTAHLVMDALAGYGGYRVTYRPQPGTDVAANPSSEELSTGLTTGVYDYSNASYRPQNRYEARGNVGYTTGKHQFKFGTEEDWEESDNKVTLNTAAGPYLLIFNKGVPDEIQTFNYPVTPVNSLYSQALFAMDTWKLGRVTLNYGLRWERYHNFYPTQSKPAGPFSPAATYPAASLLTWKDFSPRVGAAWDVFGKGKTVVKGSFALFGDTMGDRWGNTFNPNAPVTSTFTWNGPCVATAYNNVSYNNTSCNASAATLASLTPGSPNFISAVGGTNELNNPNLKQNKTYEYVAKVEQQIVPNVAVSLGYIYHRIYNLYQSLEPNSVSTASGVNILRPYGIYTVPVTLTDALTGNPVTLYTYPASYASSSFNQFELMNAPGDRPDIFHTFEAVVTRRYSKRWNAVGSFWLTKNHEWIQAISPSPNADPFPIDNTWNWEARAFGSYNLPWGFELSGLYRAQSGIYGQRTETFSSPLLLQGAVTLRMEPFGAEQGPVIAVANLKAAKNFSLGESRRLQLNFQVFNIFNNSSATSTSYLTGPTFLHVTGIVSPRVGRVGMEFTF